MTAEMIGTVSVVAAVSFGAWFLVRRRREVRCAVDLESTPEHFHAHVALEGILVEPGDEVLVHGMPSRIERGDRRAFLSTATVHQASWPRRQWTRFTGRFAFYELYDVGFEG
jgi:hypothetical protein